MKKTAIRNFTEGPVFRHLITFALPLFLSNLLQAVYNVVDMIVVSHTIGKVGLSAVSVGGDILTLLTFLAMGFSSAGQIIIAQHIGAGREHRLGRIVGNLFTLLLGGSLLLSLITFWFRRKLLAVMNTPQEALGMALQYVTMCIIGLVFIYGYNVVSAILRGMGDSRHPFMFIATAAIVNLILDIVFIAGFHLQAFGAALATVIGQGVSFIWGLVFLIRNKEQFHLSFSGNDFKPDKEISLTILELGIPMAIKSASITVSKLFVDAAVNSYGLVASGVCGIEHKFGMVSNLCSNAINTAGSTMIGQNIGAEKYDRVSRIMGAAFSIVLTVSVFLSALFLFIPETMFAIFSSDPEILAACRQMVPLLVLLFFGSASRAPNNGLIDGSGNYKLNFAVALFDGIINRIGFAVLFGKVLGFGWIGYLYGDAVAGFTPFLIGAVYFLSGKWRTRKYIISKQNGDR